MDACRFFWRWPANNHKTQGKQAEDEGVFLWFGDDLAVDDDPHRAIGSPRKSRDTSPIIEGSRIKVSNRFVDQARSLPRRSLSAAVKQVGRLIANSQTIPITRRLLTHKQAGNGSAASAGDGDGGRVGGAGGKKVCQRAARNSLCNRFAVFGVVGTGKQGRQSQQLVTGAVDVVEVAIVTINESGVSIVIVSATSNAGGAPMGCSATAGENPEGLVGVVLAGIDMDEQLRLGLLQRNKRRKRREDEGRYKATFIAPLARLPACR